MTPTAPFESLAGRGGVMSSLRSPSVCGRTSCAGRRLDARREVTQWHRRHRRLECEAKHLRVEEQFDLQRSLHALALPEAMTLSRDPEKAVRNTILFQRIDE